MRHLWYIGAFLSRNAGGYARALYVAVLLVWSLLTIWRVASGFLLETPDASPTLIKIDLLEAVAFLAAWSLLLITLTTKVVNKGRDLEFAAVELEADMRRHIEGHPDIESEAERMQAEASDLAERVTQVAGEAERVAEENEQLRRQLAARPTKDSRGDD